MKILLLALPLSMALLNGCATPQKSSPAHFDFARIQRISVAPFDGPGGPAATDEFVKALVSTGIEVTDGAHSGDAILRGTVDEYKANNQLLVFLGNTTLTPATGQTLTVDNALVSPGGAQISPEGTTLGTRNAQISSVISTAEIHLSLVDPSTRSGVWAGAMSYEALDLPNALQAVVASLTQSLSQAVPRMNKRPS